MAPLNSDFIWRDIVKFPLEGRNYKPRNQGLTMIIDKGLGLVETNDLLNIAGEYIDFIKLAFGSSVIYDKDVLQKKIDLIKSFNTHVYPGGTLLEIAILQNKLEAFLVMAKNIGFTCIEISDGTINLNKEVREKAIVMASNMGFYVLTEVGKKNEDSQPSICEMSNQVKDDLKNGASKVILEGRDSGSGVGLYNKNGDFIKDDLDKLVEQIADPRVIIWEAPKKDQQHELISRFGPNVNLGNIPTNEVIALESLRVGLRSDSLKLTL